MTTFKQILLAIYAMYLTNKFGLKMKKDPSWKGRKALRYEYSKAIMDKLKISIVVKGKKKIPNEGQHLLISNHRAVIDPVVIDMAFYESNILGVWIAKKELCYSFFYGVFVRNVGSVLLDRDSKNLNGFFKEIKKDIKQGYSINIFPEGTRNYTEANLTKFKDGPKIIAIKNRLPILPVYIRTRADKVLKNAIVNSPDSQVIIIEIGDLIDYKDQSTPLQQAYRESFNPPID